MVKQFERIYVLLNMVNEKLHYYEQDKEDIKKWLKENNRKYKSYYPFATKTAINKEQ